MYNESCNNAIELKGSMLLAFLGKAGCFHASLFDVCASEHAIERK
jgi:hypothetical protein